MKNLWLTCYCHPDCQPLKNIMRLPKGEAFAFAKMLSDAHPATTAFGRFADFEHYYPRRLKTDALLLEKFRSLGGKPQNDHPLSFVLGESDYLFHWFGEGKIIRLPLQAVAPEILSFTLGDSMSTLTREGDLAMMTLSMLLDEMKRHPGGREGYLQDVLNRYHYIEAQVWGDVEAEMGEGCV